MVGYVFLTTNSKTDKKYVGKRYAVGFDKNFFGDDPAISDDIAKNGVSGMSVEMLMPFETIEAGDYWLDHYIKEYNAESDASFYNCKTAPAQDDTPKRTRKKKSEEE